MQSTKSNVQLGKEAAGTRPRSSFQSRISPSFSLLTPAHSSPTTPTSPDPCVESSMYNYIAYPGKGDGLSHEKA